MMPDEDEKNLASMPASDSVPPSDDASTVVTEFPQHLIDALAQAAGLPARAAQATPPRDPREEQRVSALATIEVPAAAAEMVDLSGVPPSSPNVQANPSSPPARGPLASLTQLDAPTPAMGSPRFGDPGSQDVRYARQDYARQDYARQDQEAEDVVAIDDELEDLQLEPYESPISVDLSEAPSSRGSAAASGGPPPPPAREIPHAPNLGHASRPPPGPSLRAVPGAGAAEPAHYDAPSSPSFTFTPPRSAGYGAGKSDAVWAEPPPPILMDPPTSAIGWAIGGIIIGLVLLGLVVWLVVVALRHFI